MKKGKQTQSPTTIHNQQRILSLPLLISADKVEEAQFASDNKISGTNSSTLKITKQTFFGNDGKIKYQVSFAFNGVWQPERVFDTISERVHFIDALSGGSKIYKGEKQ